MAGADYTRPIGGVHEWQTLLSGLVALGGGWLAYNATRNSARDQIAAVERQNADLKLAGQRRLAQERKDVAGLLYASVGIIMAHIEVARSGIIDPLPAPRTNAIRQI